MATLRREQCQLDSRVTADPGCFPTTNKEEQGVKKRQYGDCQGGEGEKCDSSPATFLISPHQHQENNAEKQGR